MQIMRITKGQTSLILRALESGAAVQETAKKFNKTEDSIRRLAKRYNVKLPKISAEEKKIKKQALDAKCYERKRNYKNLFDPNTSMPELPMVAAKFGALSSLTTAWQLNQGFRRSSVAEGKATQIKYGLKSLIGQ